jgi:hypothetical protein
MSSEAATQNKAEALNAYVEELEGPVVLDIGYGDHPLRANPGSRFEGWHYVGIESEPGYATQFYDDKIIHTDALQSWKVFDVTLEEVHLPPESLDEVYMGNVFGFNGYRNLPIDNLVEQLPKLRNWLKPDGQLTIAETYRPPTPLNELIPALRANGFSIAEIIREGTPGWEELPKNYPRLYMQHSAVDPYVLIARKAPAYAYSSGLEIDPDDFETREGFCEAVARAMLEIGDIIGAAEALTGSRWDDVPADPYHETVSILVGQVVRTLPKTRLTKEYYSSDPVEKLKEDLVYGRKLLEANHLARKFLLQRLKNGSKFAIPEASDDLLEAENRSVRDAS